MNYRKKKVRGDKIIFLTLLLFLIAILSFQQTFTFISIIMMYKFNKKDLIKLKIKVIK